MSLPITMIDRSIRFIHTKKLGTIYRNFSSSIFETMPSPAEIRAQMPLTQLAAKTVSTGRKVLKNILERHDPRFIIITGPCSIHDPIAAFDYATRLKKLAEELSDTLYIVMRAYLEKPRSTIGWKGFINDPYLDGSSHIDIGMKKARHFLLAVNELGLPIATEALDLNSPRYLGDLISWAAIGARTSESQTHREMASGFQVPVGFKNSTDGSLDSAVNAIFSASRAHSFLGINNEGHSAIIRTNGNPYGHLVLRGGGGKPNYDRASVALAEQALDNVKLPKNIIIDCSHANSFKNHKLQELVLSDVVQQIRDGNRSIIGAMLESNIEAGNQPLVEDLSKLRYGCSITDACIDWPTTENLLRQAHSNLKKILPQRMK